MFFNTSISKYIKNSIYSLNNSKYVVGILMITLNILSKYISVKFTRVQEAYIKNLLSRQLLIFTVAFIATRDVIVALMLTLSFIVFVDYLLNEESRCCIIPKHIQIRMRELENSLLSDDSEDYPSDDEIQKAKNTINKAKQHEDKKRIEKNKHIFSMMYIQ